MRGQHGAARENQEELPCLLDFRSGFASSCCCRPPVRLQVAASTFLHRATAANITNNYTVIDNAATNGNPSALLEVSGGSGLEFVVESGGAGGAYDASPYQPETGDGKMMIKGKGRADVPLGHQDEARGVNGGELVEAAMLEVGPRRC